MRLLQQILILLVLVTCAFGETVEAPEDDVPNIPLPRQNVYTGKGMSIGIGVGVFRASEDCDCLGVWQGQGDFFYFKYLSGGIDVRFFGGDLDSDVMVMYQRYRANLRGHLPLGNLDLFFSPILGFENTDMQKFRDEWKNRETGWWHGDPDLEDSTVILDDCERAFALDGFSLGGEFGFGWRFSRLFGLTGSAQFEHNFKGAQLLSLTPGFAFNLREVWPWGKRNLMSNWLSLEFHFRRYFNRGVPDWATASFLGIQIGI